MPILTEEFSYKPSSDLNSIFNNTFDYLYSCYYDLETYDTLISNASKPDDDITLELTEETKQELENYRRICYIKKCIELRENLKRDIEEITAKKIACYQSIRTLGDKEFQKIVSSPIKIWKTGVLTNILSISDYIKWKRQPFIKDLLTGDFIVAIDIYQDSFKIFTSSDFHTDKNRIVSVHNIKKGELPNSIFYTNFNLKLDVNLIEPILENIMAGVRIHFRPSNISNIDNSYIQDYTEVDPTNEF
ncbi:hypothetical protein [Carp edema virus]|nr:hypothetical protein [Carp edema virus]